MIVIPNWQAYTGVPALTKLNISSPYQSNSAVVDSQFEEGGFSGGKVDQLTADKITTGVLTAVATLGGGTSGYTRMDGENNRIVVNDGTNDRVGIGDLP